MKRRSASTWQRSAVPEEEQYGNKQYVAEEYQPMKPDTQSTTLSGSHGGRAGGRAERGSQVGHVAECPTCHYKTAVGS